MATESKVILQAETGEAIKNVAQLRETIKAYKEALNDTDATAEENIQTANALAQAQAMLRDVMHSSTEASVKNAMEVDTMTASYNTLVHSMSELTKAWRASTDEVERAQLGEKINQINSQLKSLDATRGNFQRNVGNYGNQLGQAFTQAGGIIGGPFQKAVMSGNMALKAMSANPIVMIVGVLINLFSRLIDSLKSSEETMNSVNSAMSVFSGISDAVTKVLQGLGKALAWVVEGLSSFVNFLVGSNEAMKEHQRIAEAEIELQKRQREATIKNAEAERDIAQLKAQAAERDKLTSEERLALLEKAAQKEREIAQRAYEDAKLAYEIQKAKNSLTESSTEEKNKEAEAYAAMVKAETAYYTKVKEVNSQMSETRKKMAEEAKKALKEERDAVKAQIQVERDLIKQKIELSEKGSVERLALEKEALNKEYIIAVADAKAKITDKTTLNETLKNLTLKLHRDEQALEREHQKTLESIRTKGLMNIANSYVQGTREYLEAMRDVRKAELDGIVKEEGETMEDFNARRLQAQKNYYDAIVALNNKSAKEATQPLEEAYAKSARTTADTLAYQKQMAEANVRIIETLGKQASETQAEYEIRLANARHESAVATEAYLDYEDSLVKKSFEDKMLTLEEGSTSYLATALELRKYELDTLHQMEEESDEEFYTRKLQLEKNYTDAKKALAAKQIELAQNAASSVSSILGSLADIYEDDTDASEAELRKAKNLRIAGATIDMLSGVVTAFSNAMSLGPVKGPIMAAVNSAAVIAAGTANINKIKSQSTSKNSGSSSSTSAQVSAPQVTANIPEVRNITSASEEERLNYMAYDQKVYILSSDLEANENDRKVQIQESSF